MLSQIEVLNSKHLPVCIYRYSYLHQSKLSPLLSIFLFYFCFCCLLCFRCKTKQTQLKIDYCVRFLFFFFLSAPVFSLCSSSFDNRRWFLVTTTKDCLLLFAKRVRVALSPGVSIPWPTAISHISARNRIHYQSPARGAG